LRRAKIFLGRILAHCAACLPISKRNTPRFLPKAKFFRERQIDDRSEMLMLWALVVGFGEKWRKMLLTGTYDRAIDEKLRLAMPKPFREAFEDDRQLVLTPGTDGSLSLFSSRTFASLADQLAARSPSGQEVRAFSRLLYAQSRSVELDSQGRIRLPAELAKLGNLEGDVVVLGVGDHVELWNKSRWEAYLADLQPRYDQLAEAALSEREAAAEGQSPTEVETRMMQPR
jgi:MraZ protein